MSQPWEGQQAQLALWHTVQDSHDCLLLGGGGFKMILWLILLTKLLQHYFVWSRKEYFLKHFWFLVLLFSNLLSFCLIWKFFNNIGCSNRCLTWSLCNKVPFNWKTFNCLGHSPIFMTSNPKFYFWLQKSLSLDYVLSQLNPNHVLLI